MLPGHKYPYLNSNSETQHNQILLSILILRVIRWINLSIMFEDFQYIFWSGKLSMTEWTQVCLFVFVFSKSLYLFSIAFSFWILFALLYEPSMNDSYYYYIHLFHKTKAFYCVELNAQILIIHISFGKFLIENQPWWCTGLYWTLSGGGGGDA